MARKWYEGWIGRELTDNGRKCKLTDIFYFTDDNGRDAETGYAVYYEDTGCETIMSLPVFREIVAQNR